MLRQNLKQSNIYEVNMNIQNLTADPKSLIDHIVNDVKQGSGKDIDFGIGIIATVLIRLIGVKIKKILKNK